MFPAVTVPFLFQAFALSQCSESSRVLNLKTPSLIIAYLAPSLCSIPKVFAFLSQCWNTFGNGFTHVMWCHLILLKLNPTHRMNGKAEDLEKKESWNVKAYLFIHHRRAFTVVLKKKNIKNAQCIVKLYIHVWANRLQNSRFSTQSWFFKAQSACCVSDTLHFQPYSRTFVWLFAHTWTRKNEDCFAV